VSVKFYHDFVEWRRTRPEYASLTDAIKNGVKFGTAELEGLADEAGLTRNELIELISLHQRASAENAQREAKRSAAVEKELTKLVADIEALDKKIELEPIPFQRDRLQSELITLVDRLPALKAEAAACRLSRSLVEVGKQSGVA
jgi:hypothetical protein